MHPPRILPPKSAEKRGTGCVSSNPPGPSEAVKEQDATRPNTRSRARTVDGAAHERARIGLQGGVRAPVNERRRTAMGGVNAAIEVGKQQLVVQLGSQGEQFSEANEPRAIKRIAQAAFASRLRAGVYRGWFLPKRADCGF